MLSIFKKKHKTSYDNLDVNMKNILLMELKKSIQIHATNLECYSIDFSHYLIATIEINNERIYIDNIPIKPLIEIVKECTKRAFIVYTEFNDMNISHYTVCFVQNLENVDGIVINKS
jgi:hypothetical protein